MTRETSDTVRGTGRIKSPQYPYCTLKDSIEDATRLFLKEDIQTMQQETAARHLGYSGLNGGLAARRISAMKQFGLAEFPQPAHMRLTSLFMSIHQATDDRERLSAMVEAMYSPPIFRDLFEEFGGLENFPSDQALKAMLVQERSFNPVFVGKFIRKFRESVRYLLDAMRSSGDPLERFEEPKTSTLSLVGEVRSGATDLALFPYLKGQKGVAAQAGRLGMTASGGMSGDGGDASFDQVAIRLPRDRRVLLFLPQEFYEEDKEYIRKQLEIIWSPNRSSGVSAEPVADIDPAEQNDAFL